MVYSKGRAVGRPYTICWLTEDFHGSLASLLLPAGSEEHGIGGRSG